MDTRWVDVQRFCGIARIILRFNDFLSYNNKQSSLSDSLSRSTTSIRWFPNDFHSRSRAWLCFFGICDFMTSTTVIEVVWTRTSLFWERTMKHPWRSCLLGVGIKINLKFKSKTFGNFRQGSFNQLPHQPSHSRPFTVWSVDPFSLNFTSFHRPALTLFCHYRSNP